MNLKMILQVAKTQMDFERDTPGTPGQGTTPAWMASASIRDDPTNIIVISIMQKLGNKYDNNHMNRVTKKASNAKIVKVAKQEHTKNVGGGAPKEKAAVGPWLTVCVAFGLKIAWKSEGKRWCLQGKGQVITG